MIHILTLTWNGLDKLKQLNESLERAVTPLGRPLRWYIRDNGSTDGTVEWLKSYRSNWLDMKPLFVDHNRDNFANCVNDLAIEAAPRINGSTKFMQDDYVLLLNNDITFGDQLSLCHMVKLMDEHPRVGVVGARLLYPGTNMLQHGGVIFGKKYNNLPYHYRHREESTKHTEKNRYFQAVTAACCLIRGNAYQILDSNYSWAFEDVDLCLSIGLCGWKIAYCGETKIYHEESATLNKNPVHKMFTQSNVKYFRKKWTGKYEIDHEKYLKNPNYNAIK